MSALGNPMTIETTPEAPPIMTIRGIRKAFGPVQALNGVDLDIRPGEVHAIVGENGAGKSTLIAIAAGVLKADSGTIVFDGGDVGDPAAAAKRAAGVSVAYQHPALAFDLSVLENLQLAAAKLSGPDGRSLAEAIVRRVATDELMMPLDRRVGELTLAQRFVVEIARALAAEPRVMFFDEPTEPFQQAEIRKLFELINALRREGVAVLYVSHRLHEVKELADRISVMRDGEVIDSRPAAAISDSEIVTLIAGRPLGQVFPHKAGAVGEAILETRGLSGPGFSGVDFVARSGEIVGLAGVEGEGQREFLRAVAGLGARSEGTLLVKGEVRSGHAPGAMRRSGIGFVPEDRHDEGLFLALSIRENLGLGSLGRISRNGLVDRPAEIGRGNDIVQQLRVKAPSIEAAVANLSGGNQQKVLIGREMAAEPTVLLVDEPTKGVDVGARAEIYQRLRALADQGLAVVVCSSDGIELEGLCDRVLIFARGQVVRELTGAEVTDASITEANLTATVSRSAGLPAAAEASKWRRRVASDHFPAAILAGLTAIVLVLTQIANPYFLTGFNIATMLAFLAIVTFISMGQAATILVGGIDLSVGALAGFVVVLASFLAPSHASPALVVGSMALILAITTGFGLLQGWLATAMRIPAIIVTLASFVGLQGLSLAFRPQAEGMISDTISDIAQFPLIGIPLGMVLALAVVAGFEWILYRRPLGRRLRAVGSNPLAAERLGISRSRHVLLAFGLSGLFTGIGGLMLAGQVGIGSPATGIDYTLMSITAVVLGGASVAGGRVSILCTLAGAALVQAISSASSFINSDSAVHYSVLGLVTLLAAVFFSVARLRRGAR
jgi:ribose transport system ATP-binding protein